jgi:hypothetical protein
LDVIVTTYNTVIPLLLEEIANRIIGLVPNKEGPNKRFRQRTDKEQQQADIEEMSEKTRLFEVGAEPESVRTLSVGNTSHMYEVTFLVKISYPSTPDWRAAGVDDLIYIAADLRTHVTSVTGCSWRGTDPKDAFGIAETGKDNWDTRTLRVRAILDLTTT